MTNSTQTTEVRGVTNPDEYNGWPNRETWAASLHLSNDFGLYEMVNGWANDARREAIEDAKVDRFGFYAKGVTSIERHTVTLLGDKLSDYIDDVRASIIDNPEGTHYEATREERMMVLEIGSEWRVDWYHLAENWLEGFEFEDDES